MQEVIIAIAVALAVIYIGRRYYLQYKNQMGGGCDCGCSSCGEASDCSEAGDVQIRPELPKRH